jgi:hypothetical protein
VEGSRGEAIVDIFVLFASFGRWFAFGQFS